MPLRFGFSSIDRFGLTKCGEAGFRVLGIPFGFVLGGSCP